MCNEKIIDRIKKLLATASDKGATENEAMIAALKAQELMAKYNIELSEVQLEEDKDEIVKLPTETGTGNKWKFVLAHTVADNFCCRHFFIGKETVVFYGYRKNAEVAREVFKFLFNAGNKFATRYYFKIRNGGQDTKGVKNAFLDAYVNGVKSVLEKQCTALMLVVPQKVSDSFDDLCKKNHARTISGKFNRRKDDDIAENAKAEGYRTGVNTAQARYLE